MADPKAPALPPEFRQPSLFANLVWIGKEDLAGNREYLFIRESIQQRLEKIRFHAHVAIQQHHYIVPSLSESRVGAAAEAEIFFERHHADLGKAFADECGATIGRTVIHHDDFAPGDAPRRGDHRRKILFEKIAAIPVGNHDRGRTSVGPSLLVQLTARR